MKIPKTLKIGAHQVRIKYKDFSDDEKVCGEASYTTGEIGLNKKLSGTRLEASLIHEIIHHLNTTLDNTLLDSLAEQLYQVLVENKLLR